MSQNLAALGAAVLLAACGPALDPDLVAPASGDLVVEIVTVDSTAVQEMAPPMPPPISPEIPEAIVAYVEGAQPRNLVVYCHGLNQDARTVWRDQVIRTVTDHPDTVALATNYRDNEAFPIGKGAHDVVAATLDAKRRFPSVERVVLFGVSMGGAISGTAITESTYVSGDGLSLFHYWVAAEPLVMLAESHTEALIALPEIAQEIEDDAGGAPAEVPEEYVRRSPALNAVHMAQAGLRAVAIVHGVNDGLVPYNQGREMATTAAAAGIPTQLHTVLRVAEDQDTGNTLTGAITGAAGVDDPAAPLRLSGHGYEGDPAHPVMRTGFALVAQILKGGYDEATPYSETVVDDGG